MRICWGMGGVERGRVGLKRWLVMEGGEWKGIGDGG